MKVVLTTGNFTLKTSRQHRKLKVLQDRLMHDKTLAPNLIDHRRFLFKLSEILLFPDSYFIALPTPLLHTLVVQIYRCLERHQEPFSVDTLASDNHQQFIVISCPNLKYVVDSLQNLQENRTYPFQILAHPVLSITRQGDMISGLENNDAAGRKRLLIILRLETIGSIDRERFLRGIESLLTWALKLEREKPRLQQQLTALRDIEEFESYRALIDWLAGSAFVPFKAWQIDAAAIDNFDAGELCSEFFTEDDNATERQAVQRELNGILARSTPLIVQQVPLPSPLMPAEKLIYLGFREGAGAREHGFFGLFDTTELNGAACKIPVLHRKIEHLLEQIRSDSNSYEYLQLREILNLFPKVDLFLLDEAQSRLIMQSLKRYLYRPESIKLLILSSPSPNRLSVLVVIPQPLHREEMEAVIEAHLCRETAATVEWAQTMMQCGHFLGLHYVLRSSRHELTLDVDSLDRDLNRLARPWSVTMRGIMERAYGKSEGSRLWGKYRNTFPASYQDIMPPRYAVKDIRMLERLLGTSEHEISLLSPCHPFKYYRLHFFSLKERFLDEYIPVLGHLSLRVMDQVQFPLEVQDKTIFIKSFSISAGHDQRENFSKLKERLLDCIRAVIDGKAENDVLNSLVLHADLSWQQVDVLRAYRNYYLQLGYQTSGDSFNHALINNPQVARHLFDYFDIRFRPDPNWADPVAREEQALFPLRLQLLESMATVKDINDDKILRTLFNLIDATMRTNFHVRRDLEDYFIAFKINSLGIIEMPPPRPEYEIYVHAFMMEGIHLRGGKVSRGGIRWSDRPDDFRTEILGLMQTQMSKNALIIPKGAKGGFVVKRIPAGQGFKEAGKKAYVTLMQGLLDLTDNYVHEQVIKLPGIVSYDDHDPYLVVAADKGTAQFSDLANSVAAHYHFWLGDAFASGGSTGYNHKQLGITARGAWECVKRHFRELGSDIQTQPFTVVGIGSMDGDVFGNGMLLSRCIRLQAAISGQHIFIDPNPADLEQAYLERKRLFELPGSSWNDYDRHLISEGGGVFLRNAKDINVSPQMRKWLGIRYKSLDGTTLIRYLLSAEVDLLWLGGIGTYVKASTEKNEEVGDRSNDEVRLDALQLRAKVVGEGANLGFTQKARIEYALAGGHINTDAVDNSAGVDTSDHEVNLKILLNDLHKKGLIDDYQRLFSELTDTVCASVLDNNYRQSLCLSLDQIRCRNNAEAFLQLAEKLENAGVLDRNVESFPRAKEVMARAEQRITRPELAVLMASAKIQMTQMLLDQGAWIAEKECDRYLEAYFPETLRRDFRQYLSGHPLASTIKATVISNQLINQCGCVFLGTEIDNGQLIDGATAYLTFDQVLNGDALRLAIFGLDNRVDPVQQHRMLLMLENRLSDFCQWTLARGMVIRPDRDTLENYRACLEISRAVFDAQEGPAAEAIDAEITAYREQGVPDKLACRIVFIDRLTDFPMRVALTAESERDFQSVGRILDELAVFLQLDHVFQQLNNLVLHDYWERKVFKELRADFKQSLFKMALAILSSGSPNPAAFFASSPDKSKIYRYQRLLKEIDSTQSVNLLPYLTLAKALDAAAPD